MFGRKRKKDNNIVDFKTKNYEMSESYESANLVVANLQYISSRYTDYGPMVETTKQKYIFEVITQEEETRYREVFSGFVANDKEEFFDLPYVVNVKPLNETINNVAETVPKYGLLLLLDQVNRVQKVKVHRKQQKN